MQREKKTEIITLRVTPQVKERIRAKAQELGLTVTDYLCLCGLGKEIVRVDGLDQVLSELKAQGRNSEPAHHPGQHGKDHRRVRGQAGGELRTGQRTAPAAPAGGDLRWLLSPQSKIEAGAVGRWAACCDTPSRTKRRCGRDGIW